MCLKTKKNNITTENKIEPRHNRANYKTDIMDNNF